MEVWYVALIDKPRAVAERLLECAGLHSNPIMADYAETHIKRQHTERQRGR